MAGVDVELRSKPLTEEAGSRSPKLQRCYESSMLAGALDLLLDKINQDNINSCIDEILKHTKRTESWWIYEGERKENNLEHLCAVDVICTLGCCRAREMKVGHSHRLRVGQDCFGMVRGKKNGASRDKGVRGRGQERHFVTSAMLSLQHSVGHRTKRADCVSSQSRKRKRRGNWDRQIHRIPFAQKVPRYTCVETTNLWRSGSMGLVRWDQRTENKWRVCKGHCIRCGGGKLLIQWNRSMTT